MTDGYFKPKSNGTRQIKYDVHIWNLIVLVIYKQHIDAYYIVTF